MDSKQLVRGLGVGRVAFGIAFLVAPGVTGRLWIGDGATKPGARTLTRAVGARDLVMGAGILAASEGGRPVRDLLQQAGAVDVLDFTATLLAGGRLPTTSRRLTLAVAASAAAQCFYAATAVDD